MPIPFWARNPYAPDVFSSGPRDGFVDNAPKFFNRNIGEGHARFIDCFAEQAPFDGVIDHAGRIRRLFARFVAQTLPLKTTFILDDDSQYASEVARNLGMSFLHLPIPVHTAEHLMVRLWQPPSWPVVVSRNCLKASRGRLWAVRCRSIPLPRPCGVRTESKPRYPSSVRSLSPPCEQKKSFAQAKSRFL